VTDAANRDWSHTIIGTYMNESVRTAAGASPIVTRRRLRLDRRPASGFVLRAAGLPVETLVTLADGLCASANADSDDKTLAAAIDRDRQLLGERLREMAQSPSLASALELASADLVAALERAGESAMVGRVERSLARYVLRAAGRATPFGLFSGCAHGVVDDGSTLEVTHTQATYRLDVERTEALVRALASEDDVRAQLSWRPHPALERLPGGRCAIPRVRNADANRSSSDYQRVVMRTGRAFWAVVERARSGSATLTDLADAISDMAGSAERAQRFVEELASLGLLRHELETPVTGVESLTWLLERLGQLAPAASAVRTALVTQAESLRAMSQGPSPDPKQLRELSRNLAALGAGDVPPARCVRADLHLRSSGLRIGSSVVDELERAAAIAAAIARHPSSTALSSLARRFAERFEGRAVPLLEAFDEELGVGWSALEEPSLAVAGPDDARERWIVNRALEAISRNEPLELSAAEVSAVSGAEIPALPALTAAIVKLVAPSAQALNSGEFELLLMQWGVPPVGLLGRFCHTDPEIEALVRELLAHEEAQDPDAVFAEIASRPPGRLGNVVDRPLLRGWEIDYCGPSGAAPERQLPLDDLLVMARRGRLILWSSRLGRRVEPRMSNALSLGRRRPPLLRFLALLEQRQVDPQSWTWPAALERCAHLPRVRTGRSILAVERWCVADVELARWSRAGGASRLRAVWLWRDRERVPRWVRAGIGDQLALIDLDNVLAVDLLVAELARDPRHLVEEAWPVPGASAVRGRGGTLEHELLIPFLSLAPANTSPLGAPATTTTVVRRFPPGSQWLYVKLYGASAVLERLLAHRLAPVCERLVADGAIDRWFALRMEDPDEHLRIRLHGDPRRLLEEALSELQDATASLQEDGRIWRVALDTYEREVERYGGDDGVEAAEEFFWHDSCLLAAMLDEKPDAEQRFWVAVAGSMHLLATLRDDRERAAVMGAARAALREALGVATSLARLHADTTRRDLPLVRSRAHSEDMARATAAAFERWRQRVDIPLARIAKLQATGKLTAPPDAVVTSFVHLHCHRMLSEDGRRTELRLQDLLAQHYGSAAARTSESRP